jgi:phosphoenolpyruvate synthase/pyruvate phosphate dikinase
VTPDSFAVSKVTGEITGRRVGVKLRVHSFTPNGHGISAAPMPFALRRSACLSDDEARALTQIGQQVEDHYGAPQDIEWALLGDSSCHRRCTPTSPTASCCCRAARRRSGRPATARPSRPRR